MGVTKNKKRNVSISYRIIAPRILFFFFILSVCTPIDFWSFNHSSVHNIPLLPFWTLPDYEGIWKIYDKFSHRKYFLKTALNVIYRPILTNKQTTRNPLVYPFAEQHPYAMNNMRARLLIEKRLPLHIYHRYLTYYIE